jgi:LasA protease
MSIHSHSRGWLVPALAVAITALGWPGAVAGAAPPVGPVAAPAAAAPGQGALRAAVTAQLLRRSGTTAQGAAAGGRQVIISFRQSSADGAWQFGTAVLTAPHRAGVLPDGWLFLAQRGQLAWQVGFDGSAAFRQLAGRAPTSVVPVASRHAYTASLAVTPLAVPASNNTGLRLPYALSQSWVLTGGPHGWSGDTPKPWSSIDLSGGDGRVLAAGGGTATTLCSGWQRIVHDNGWSTDYYHLFNTQSFNQTRVSAGSYLGNIGTNTTCGGFASGAHVHFALLAGGVYQDLQWKAFGKWVVWEGSATYQGFALHGSTQVNVGGSLFNYGGLSANQGIVDAWGSGSVNKRSGPGTNFAIVGSVSDGTTVTISCWRNGTTITGRYGTTSVWDKLTDGTWISDALAYTGVNTIGPQC